MFRPRFRCLLLGAWLALAPLPLAAQEPLPPWPPAPDGLLAHDPAVVWGRLPNGVRYVVLPAGAPPDRVSLRLLVEAGSLMESEAQRGLAHFLEHMAFKGSTNLDPGEFVAFLQREGLAFGADTNARTGFDQTVYQLDLPRDDPALVDESIGILAEIAGRLTLAPDQIEPERGVILSEKRLRDTPGARSSDAMLDFLLPGSLYAQREPIGLESVIRNAPRAEFEAFYRSWYTPERLVVIVTGDVQPDAVAAAVARHFGDFVQPAAAPADPVHAPLAPRSLDAMLVSDPALPTRVSLNVVLPYDDRPDSLARQRDMLEQLLASAMLDRRLESLGLQPGAPFSRASTGAFDLAPAARIALVSLTATPETWQAALAVGEQELRRALTHGFTQAELDEQLAIFRNQLETVAAGAATREADDLADQLASTIGSKAVFTSPQTDLELLAELTRSLRPADLDAALRRMWEGREPQIFVTGPMQLADGRAEILAAYEASRAVAVAAPAERKSDAFAYTEFGQPSGVVASEELPGLGITRVRYGNGVVLYVKPTPFEAGAVRVAVRFGSGKIGLPADQPGLDLLAGRGFIDGGLGRHSIDEINRILAARQVGIDLIVGESGVNLVGRTTPADLPLQLDLLAAYLIDPGFRPEAQERYRARIASAYASMAAVPDGVVSGPVSLLVHGGDPRFGMPPQADAERRTLAELRAWLEPMLRQGPLQVMVVGDVDPARVVAEVGRTLGALPARGDDPRPPAPSLVLPAVADPVRFTHSGQGNQALAMVYWPTTGQGDARTSIGLDLVADILTDRLLRAVRERDGATYSPQVNSQQSLALPGFGYLVAAIDASGADAARIVDLIRETGDQMRAGGITEDEFQRALQPRLAQARNALQSNEYWLYGVLFGAEQFPRVLDQARTLLADTEGQTLAGVQALAASYLDPAKALPVLVVPQS
jgi:zinc protease